MTKKRGRPKLAARDYRGEFLILRLRAVEKRTILEAARKAGVRYTDWARSILLAAARLPAER